MGIPVVDKMPVSDEILCGFKNNWSGIRETEWCLKAMENRSSWLPVLGIDDFDYYELEKSVSIDGSGNRRTVLPRMDAVGWNGDVATIIEAKVKVTPSTMLGGVGQLLYYKEIMESMGTAVGRLILISPSWPSFFLRTVEKNKLPISLIQINDDMIYGVNCGNVE